MKKVLLILISLLIMVMPGCEKKEEKYFEEKQILENLIRITNLFSRELDRTNNRIALGRTVVNYTSDIKRLKPDMWKLEKICPEYLTSVGYKKAPKELQPLFKKFAETLTHMKLVADGKMAKFSQDSNLIKIFEELKEALYFY